MKTSYQVIRLEIGASNNIPIIEVIKEFEHSDISSNSFLRAWTGPAWAHHHLTQKERNLEVKLEPFFGENIKFEGFDNFHAPLTLVALDPKDTTMRLIRYFVVSTL